MIYLICWVIAALLAWVCRRSVKGTVSRTWTSQTHLHRQQWNLMPCTQVHEWDACSMIYAIITSPVHSVHVTQCVHVSTGQVGMVVGLLFAFLVLLPALLLLFYCYRIKTSYYHKWLSQREKNKSNKYCVLSVTLLTTHNTDFTGTSFKKMRKHIITYTEHIITQLLIFIISLLMFTFNYESNSNNQPWTLNYFFVLFFPWLTINSLGQCINNLAGKKTGSHTLKDGYIWINYNRK